MPGVMRPGRSLGVVLHRKNLEFFMLHPLAGSVIQVDMCHPHIFIGDRIHVHREAVVLRRDLDAFCPKIDHRLITAVVAKL